jgi:hypothetical protein
MPSVNVPTRCNPRTKRCRLRASRRDDGVPVGLDVTVLSSRRNAAKWKVHGVPGRRVKLPAGAAMSFRQHDATERDVRADDAAAMSVGLNDVLFGSKFLPHGLGACQRGDVPVGLCVTVLSGRPDAAAEWNVRAPAGALKYDHDHDDNRLQLHGQQPGLLPAGERYPVSARTESCQRRLLSAQFDAEQWRLPRNRRVVRRRHPVNVLPSRLRRELHDFTAVLSKVGIDHADGIAGRHAGTDTTAAAGGITCAGRSTGRLRRRLSVVGRDLRARAWRNDRPHRSAGSGPGWNAWGYGHAGSVGGRRSVRTCRCPRYVGRPHEHECRLMPGRPRSHLARLRSAVERNTRGQQCRR